MDNLRRLDIAKGYMELLTEVDNLRLDFTLYLMAAQLTLVLKLRS